MTTQATSAAPEQALSAHAAKKWSNHPRSLTRDALHRLLRNWAAVGGFAFIVLVILIAIFAPLLAPYSPSHQDLLATYASPSLDHLLGTDQLGRDIFSRLIFGARVSMSVALVTATLVMIIGVPVGVLAGYLG